MDNGGEVLHLYLLLHDRIKQLGLESIRMSLSCLREHPGIPVTLIDLECGLSERTLLDFMAENFENDARVTGGDVLQPLANETTNRPSPPSYFLFLPVGDWLSDDAADRITGAARKNCPDIIYTDEDRINEKGHLVNPQFKPDAAPDFFLHSDYVGTLLCIKKTTLAQYGGINLKQYQEERYRLLLHAFSERAQIEHIAAPLYHARTGVEDVCTDPCSVLKRHCKEHGIDAEVEQITKNAFRLKHKIKGNPKVSIVIPFKDKPELLKQCLDAVVNNTSYDNFEVIGISNRSQSLSVYELMQAFSAQDRRLKFFEHNIPFNFSALVNFGVFQAMGEFIVLMNNDITVINSGWLKAMLEYGQKAEIGVVGAKLLYPDDTIQHAGISVQQSGYIGHLHKHHSARADGYMNRLICVQNVSAVTGALCLFRKKLHQQLGGFNESRFKIAFNDVDFCLRAELSGYTNVFTPYALAYHHESLSRGYETTSDKKQRFFEEQKSFTEFYAQRISRGDPYYNPNLNQNRDDFSY